MRYTSDLTDTEWPLIDYGFPEPSQQGRPREHSYRELLNAVFYVVKTGCQWRNLPSDFAPWGTVYHYLRTWKRNGLWVQIHTHLREQVRVVAGRNRQPSAAILDSQSVKSPESSDERGCDAGKKVTGRKRPILGDPIGLLLRVLGLPATIQERDGARPLLSAFFRQSPRRRVKHIWADGGYAWGFDPVGQEPLALHRRSRQAQRTAPLQGAAAPLGGRAHLRLARPLPPPQSRSRTPRSDGRNHGLFGDDSPHVGPLGKRINEFSNKL